MMDPIQKFSIASQLEFQMEPLLYFRLNERIKKSAPAQKAYETPDLQINLDTNRHLIYLYVVDFNDNDEVAVRQSHLNYLLKNTEALFGVITDGTVFHLYRNDICDKLILLGKNTLQEMCQYFNSQWIELSQYPPLEENDYSYTKSGGNTSIIIDKLDAAYFVDTMSAVPGGVAYPIPLTIQMLTQLIGFSSIGSGKYELNDFEVQVLNNIFYHNSIKFEYLSQLQQCYRRERGELIIDEILLPNYI